MNTAFTVNIGKHDVAGISVDVAIPCFTLYAVDAFLTHPDAVASGRPLPP